MLHPTILVLDSYSIMRAAICEVLESAGYLVIATGRLGDAVDRLSVVAPDLLVIAPYINNMPGRIAASYLRSRCPGMPVLIVAGFMDDDRVNVQNAIRDIYVFPRPFSRSEFLTRVKDILKCESERSDRNPQRTA